MSKPCSECYKLPKETQRFAVCESCKDSICEECKVEIGDNTYCPFCADGVMAEGGEK